MVDRKENYKFDLGVKGLNSWGLFSLAYDCQLHVLLFKFLFS